MLNFRLHKGNLESIATYWIGNYIILDRKKLFFYLNLIYILTGQKRILKF